VEVAVGAVERKVGAVAEALAISVKVVDIAEQLSP